MTLTEMFLAFQEVEDVSSLALDVFRYGGLGGSMFLAYRLTTNASKDATATAKTIAHEANERLKVEREYWQARESALLAQITAMTKATDEDPND